MINNYLQLSSWLLSVLIGFIYYILLNVYFLYFHNKNIVMRVIAHILFIAVISILLIYIYYKFNGGYIHYGYPLFYLTGYLLAKRVNKYVNRLKKTIFLKK